MRERLSKELRERFVNLDNIVVLPEERSFITSWGSWYIARAMFEVQEELCRLGIWDYIVDLSGADLPLRSVDDLALTLAPYRGTTFLSFHGTGYYNAPNWDGTEATKESDAWYACDGFNFNVTRTNGYSNFTEFKFRSASQWSVLSRSFVESLLDQRTHSEKWREYNFKAFTNGIPDESYLATFAVNNPKLLKDVKSIALHYLKPFTGRDAYNLCRHKEVETCEISHCFLSCNTHVFFQDGDLCGQGPGHLTKDDIGTLGDSSHRYFFSRKFETSDPGDAARSYALKMSTGGFYYDPLKPYIPQRQIHQLMRQGFMGLLKQVPDGHVVFTLNQLHIVPNLHPVHPCCEAPFLRHFQSVQEYSYILDYEALDEAGGERTSLRAKFNLGPRCDCYGFGHLRGLRVTTWTYETKSHPLRFNLPLGYFTTDATTVYAEIWMTTDLDNLNDDCKRSASDLNPLGLEAIEVGNLTRNEDNNNLIVGAEPLVIRAELVDPHGNIRTMKRKEIIWDRLHIHMFNDYKDGTNKTFHGEWGHTFDLAVSGLEPPGIWKVRMFKENTTGPPFVYEKPLLILPPPSDLAASKEEPFDLLQGFWRLETVSEQLPGRLRDLSFLVEDKGDKNILISQKQDCQCENKHNHQNVGGGNSTCPPPSVVTVVNRYHENYAMFDWLACGGGTVTLLSCAYFWFTCLSFSCSRQCSQLPSGSGGGLCCRTRSITSRGSVGRMVLVMGLSTLIQVLVCMLNNCCE